MIVFVKSVKSWLGWVFGPKRAMGTSRHLGVSADVEVPIVRTGKPEVRVVEKLKRRERNEQ